ncbi:hypothetical protein [Chryseobacterium populi]|uniref:Uncharacterized protein n=1 Tax=Chryseobacterium populi TaxID=1144316 RepID=J2T0R6_9FLAO|nr:hypothetical protein [Chryseobacterium populi]EJL71517.1 hypothetical protein PMI13_02311 [Chryseobacterium populi]
MEKLEKRYEKEKDLIEGNKILSKNEKKSRKELLKREKDKI